MKKRFALTIGLILLAGVALAYFSTRRVPAEFLSIRTPADALAAASHPQHAMARGGIQTVGDETLRFHGPNLIWAWIRRSASRFIS